MALSDNPNLAASRRPVRVALIDSGVDAAHPWFETATLTHRQVVRVDGRWCVQEGAAGDTSGHGTACAGILHRRMPTAEIVSIRALSEDGRCSKSALIASIAFAIDAAVDVVSLSLGFDLPRRAQLKASDHRPILSLYELADRAVVNNVVLVASGPNVSHFRTYPGRAKALVGVGCCQPDDGDRIRSRRTEDYDYVGPGNQVRAPALGGGERLWTGTSFAVPAVAARVAALRAEFPGMPIDQLRLLLPEDVPHRDLAQGNDVATQTDSEMKADSEMKGEGL